MTMTSFNALFLAFILLLGAPISRGEDEPKATAEGYEEAVVESQSESKQIKPDPKAEIPPAGKYPSSLVSIGSGSFFSRYAFIADKSLRTLSVWQKKNGHKELVAAFPMDLGKAPGDKKILGDHKTPEGIYFFQGTYKKNELDYNEYGERAFTLDYPNFFDKLQLKTGSGIWLHAIPETKSLFRGSRGCLVVRNEAIRQIANYIDLKKTPIVVHDKVSYLANDEVAFENKKFKAWLENWRNSWQSKDLENYMNFYAEDFSSLKMNKEQWRRYKNGLNEKYDFIHIKVHEPIVLRYNDEVVVRFFQEYESDKISDFGEKSLYIRALSNDQFQIIREDWSPAASESIALFNEKCKTGC